MTTDVELGVCRSLVNGSGSAASMLTTNHRTGSLFTAQVAASVLPGAPPHGSRAFLRSGANTARYGRFRPRGSPSVCCASAGGSGAPVMALRCHASLAASPWWTQRSTRTE